MKIFLILFSTVALTAKADFSALKCTKVISDEMRVAAKDSGVAVQWRTRGGKGVVDLLRTVADEKIPTSLLKAYGDILVEFRLPAEACEFGARLGHFQCDFNGTRGGLPFKVKARRSPYGEEEYDVYSGEFEAVAIGSEFYGKPGSRYLKFPMAFTVKGQTIAAESSFFFAHYWESEGYRQDPSCLVDNQFLVDRE